jgi:hypothetical protein
MTTDASDPRTVLEKATEAVRGATEAVQTTSQNIAWAIEADRRSGGLFDQLTRLTRRAPLGALAIAFLAGWIAARRQ